MWNINHKLELNVLFDNVFFFFFLIKWFKFINSHWLTMCWTRAEWDAPRHLTFIYFPLFILILNRTHRKTPGEDPHDYKDGVY